MNSGYLDKITHADCREHLGRLEDDSIELLLSDIPYGIALDDWDVLHSNQNSALLGESPAQRGKPAFKRRGKPINGWSRSDRNIGREYEEWCRSWAQMVFPKLKNGSSVLLFGVRRTIHRAVNAFEDSGFLFRRPHDEDIDDRVAIAASGVVLHGLQRLAGAAFRQDRHAERQHRSRRLPNTWMPSLSGKIS